MNLHLVYCNYQTAPLALRERLAFSSKQQLGEAYGRFRNEFPDAEAVLLSTCNRVELYTAQEDAERHVSYPQLLQFLSDCRQIPVSEFSEDVLEQVGPDAVRHLFMVASSVDSMVLGEPQIVSQVKDAYQVARDNDTCGPLTNALFQRAIGVSSRVRSETRLAEGRVSIASVAVGEFGKGIFDRFDDKTILVIGAGEMAEETLRYLKSEGVGRLVVVNRHLDRAQRLAAAWDGQAHPFEELDQWMAQADIIVSTTGAQQPIVDTERFAKLRIGHEERPVFILDLGAPRDFEPAVANVDDNVFLYDIDHLEQTCQRNRKAREKEVQKSLRIIETETERFMQEVYHRATGPVVRRLREEWHEVRRQELDRLFNRLSHLGPLERESIERSVERIVNKLLHPPLETLKLEAKAGTPHGLMEALKRLFHLQD